MTNFRIVFEHPWLLLLLIPAVVLTMIPYFRMNKRYRCTRNRVLSIICHLTVMTLCILICAGMQITYDVPNTENEVILLVDTSYSGKENEQAKNAFVESVINSTDAKFQIGVVTFGYEQVYAVELTDNVEGVYQKYLDALQHKSELHATDVASALQYASTLFNHPESGRIVLLSDGAETDNEAAKVIRAIAADGIKVDTVYFPNEESTNEVQLIGITPPEKSIRVGETFALELTLQSAFPANETIEIQLFDNNAESTKQTVELYGGVQTVKIETQFTVPGMHELSVDVVHPGADTSVLNNKINSYMYLEVFDKVLIIESNKGESDQLKAKLDENLDVKVVNIKDTDAMPKTLEDIRAYDEVVLCNVSIKEMPEGFEQILYSYVHDIGGGLFTVGGNTADSTEGNWKAHAYSREDMYNTTYQDMLPVEIINYTPPLAVMIIIDRSGSMYDKTNGEDYTKSKLCAALQGAEACLDELSDRDYVGIMTLSDTYSEEAELTPRPQRAKILAAIDAIEVGGGTIYAGALESARTALLANTKVEKRHIIFVTDGEPGDKNADDYLDQARMNAEAGITMSVVGVRCTSDAKRTLMTLVEAGGGEDKNFYSIDDVLKVATNMREDLQAPEIKDVNFEKFTPTIATFTSIVANIKQSDMPTLDGFYGSKLKNGATEILSGEYVPLYAYWKYGKGMVGSFMCDLNGTWSSEFMASDTSTLLLNNIVTSLFPTENIRTGDIQVELYEDNFHNTLSVFTPLAEGQNIQITVTSPIASGSIETENRVYTPEEGSGQTRIHFQITVPGLHRILVEKKNADGTVVSQRTIYKSFSYTEEYNTFVDTAATEQFMIDLAASGEGVVIENDDPWAVYENVAQYLHKVIDPRIVFFIIALVLFLTDMAVRKFKFKWLHELIRDRKANKALQA